MDDLFLVKQVLGGNKDAFKFLVLRYQRPIFKFLSTFQLSASVLEEIAQETFLRAYKNLADFDPARGASFSSWLFTISKNLAINESEKHSNKNEVYSDEKTQEKIQTLPDPQPSQEESLTSKGDHSNLVHALLKLPEDFRSAVVLSYLKELSLEEIAVIEKCSLGTVKSRIFRGKQLLRAILKEVEV